MPVALMNFAKDWPSMQGLKDAHKYIVASLIWVHCDNQKAYAHKCGNGFLIDSRMIRLSGALGRDYLRILSSTELIKCGSEYSKEREEARCYELTPAAHDFIESYHSSKPKRGVLVAVKNKGVLEKQRKPSQAVLSRDSLNNNARNKLALQTAHKINVEALQRLRKALAQHKDRLTFGITPERLTDAYRAIGEAIADKPQQEALGYVLRRFKSAGKFISLATTNADLPEGEIYQTYQECVTGRLYGYGTSLQNAPREVRHAALCGQYDYDFENCHYAILHQLAQRQGIPTPYIADYLQRKKYHRERLATALSVDSDAIKQCLIALVYGAALKTKPYMKRTSSGALKQETPAILNVLGEQAATTLLDDDFFVGLAKDIKKAGKAVTEAYRNAGNGKLINAIGKCNKGADPLAHILQGYEAKMLAIAVDLFASDISIIQHDGFTAKSGNLDTALLQREIEVQTGLKMAISCDEIKELKCNKSICSIPCHIRAVA